MAEDNNHIPDRQEATDERNIAVSYHLNNGILVTSGKTEPFDFNDENVPPRVHAYFSEGKRLCHERSNNQCSMAGCVPGSGEHTNACPFPDNRYYDSEEGTPLRHPYTKTEVKKDDIDLDEPNIASDAQGFMDFTGPEGKVQWKEVPEGDKGKSRPDFNRPWTCGSPFEFNRFRESFCRLINLENRARELEDKLDADIDDFVKKKENYFIQIGGDDFEGGEYDETPNYTDLKKHAVKFGEYGIQELGQVEFLSFDCGQGQLFEELYRRTEYLGMFFNCAKDDLDRLWFKQHDGKSARYYRKADKSPFAPLLKSLPWYLQNANVGDRLELVDQPENCLFCFFDRRLHMLEYNFARLEKYLRRWPNHRSPFAGEHKAKQLRWTVMMKKQARCPKRARHQSEKK